MRCGLRLSGYGRCWMADMGQSERRAVERFIERPEVAALFADAVAQGMHSPFSLDCDRWGRRYQDKLLDLLPEED